MKSISTPLSTHLAGELTTLAWLATITRADGTVLRFTSHDRDLTISGNLYKASNAFSLSQLENRLEPSSDNLTMIGMLDSSAIAEADLLAGRYDGAEIEIALCNWADISMGTLILRKGWLGTITIKNNSFSVEIFGLMDALQTTIADYYAPTCRYKLGQSTCGINLTSATWKKTGSVTSFTSNQSFTDSTRSEASNFFAFGELTWLTGNNAGLKNTVKTFAATLFTLWLPTPNAIQVGDTYSVTAGCDGRFSTCKSKFSNGINFGGFPHIPGVDKLLSVKR